MKSMGDNFFRAAVMGRKPDMEGGKDSRRWTPDGRLFETFLGLFEDFSQEPLMDADGHGQEFGYAQLTDVWVS